MMDDVTQNVNCTLSFGWRISDLTVNSRPHLDQSMNRPRNKEMHLQHWYGLGLLLLKETAMIPPF